MGFWQEKLEGIIKDGSNDKYFQGKWTKAEQIRYCVLMLWNIEKGRHDKICFNSPDETKSDVRDYLPDPKGKETEHPPILLAKTMCNPDEEISGKALENFYKVLSC